MVATRLAGRGIIELSLSGGQAVERRLQAIGNRVRTFGANITRVGAGITAFGAGIVAPFGLAIKSASDFQERTSKLEAVFGGLSSEVKKFAADFAEEIGRSESQITDFLGRAGDTFIPLGFEPGAAQELSETVARLAVDLASFNNISDEEAFNRLNSALVGNTENLRAFGVVAQQAQIKAEALSLGFDPANLSAQQKAQAILNLTLKGTTAAQGDALRTANGFANSSKRLGAEIENLRVEIGTALLPAATGIVSVFSKAVAAVKEFANANPEIAKVVAGVGAGLLVIGTGITAVGLGIAAIGTAFAAIGTVVGLILSPIGLIVVGIAAASAAVAVLLSRFRAVRDVVSAAFDTQVVESFKSAINSIAAGDLTTGFEIVGKTFQFSMLKAIEAIRVEFVNLIKSMSGVLAAVYGPDLTAGIILALEIGIAQTRGAVAQVRNEIDALNELAKTNAVLREENTTNQAKKVAETIPELKVEPIPELKFETLPEIQIRGQDIFRNRDFLSAFDGRSIQQQIIGQIAITAQTTNDQGLTKQDVTEGVLRGIQEGFLANAQPLVWQP